MTETGNKTFRETTLTLAGKSTTELNFPDTNPNYVHINNYSAGSLFFGRNVFPTSNMYDMIIDGFGDNLFGSPNGFKKAYLYNDGTDPVQFKITTFENDFDPATLRSTGGTSTGDTTTLVEGTVDSRIVGFNVPLPSGANNIGRVVVSEMPDQTINFTELPAGDNHIGSVDVDT